VVAIMVRQRRTVAVLCIALVVFSAFLPAGISDTVWAVLAPLGLVVTTAGITSVVRIASRSTEQRISLLSLAALRAPPRHTSPA
jgi:hypothetical protein